MKINSLQPRLVVVTGAGSGIGRATAIKFAKRGAHVVVSDIDLDAAEATTAMIRGQGRTASAARLDVTDPQAWDAFARDVLADHGYADVLVNNAGMLVGGPFLELTPADWERQLSVNLLGSCTAVVPSVLRWLSGAAVTSSTSHQQRRSPRPRSWRPIRSPRPG